MEDKYNQYDLVVSTIMTNILVERERCGKFLLYDFDPNFAGDRLYFNVTAVAADLRTENIYLDMRFLDYIKFRFKCKKRKNLKWFGPIKKRKLSDEYKTSVMVIIGFVAEKLNIQYDLFGEINDEYYGWFE